MQSDDALWRQFICTKGFTRSLDTQFWREPLAGDQLKTLQNAPWIGARKTLKARMHSDEYQKLLARFRQFKRRQKRGKVIVELDVDVAHKLQQIKQSLGMQEHDENINEVIDYLLMAEPEQVWNLNRQTKTDLAQEVEKPLLQRLIRMKRQLHFLHEKTVGDALQQVFVDGVRAGRQGQKNEAALTHLSAPLKVWNDES